VDYEIDVINLVQILNHLLCQEVNVVHLPCIKGKTSKLVINFSTKPYQGFEEDP
jgi:hypothetical protein